MGKSKSLNNMYDSNYLKRIQTSLNNEECYQLIERSIFRTFGDKLFNKGIDRVYINNFIEKYKYIYPTTLDLACYFLERYTKEKGQVENL